MRENGNRCCGQQWNCRGRNVGMNRGCPNCTPMETRNERETCENREKHLKTCYGDIEPVDHMPIGIGYVPWQQFAHVMDAESGLAHGTIFKELVMPYGTRCMGREGK